MSIIGVYDSGIGGLTTLAVLKKQFKTDDFYYYADNANHPFGSKSNKELQPIISGAISKIKNRCDIVVLACNTASSVYEGTDVIRLLPPFDFTNPSETLLMATESTLSNTDTKDVKTANSGELASLIEIQASINQIKGNLDMSALRTYLKIRLYKFKGVKKVILGCSHYPLCKKEISKLLGDVRFFDGNESVVNSLEKYVSPLKNESKITFVRLSSITPSV